MDQWSNKKMEGADVTFGGVEEARIKKTMQAIPKKLV